MTDDFVTLVCDEFCILTGRVSASVVDYAQAQDWENTGMPVDIVLTALRESVTKHTGKKWLPRMRISWIAPQVEQGYQSWKRAIGPSYRSAE